MGKGMDETRQRTHTRGTLNTNTLCHPGTTILVGHPVLSGVHGKLAAVAVCLEQVLVHCLEGWCQTELLVSGLLLT